MKPRSVGMLRQSICVLRNLVYLFFLIVLSAGDLAAGFIQVNAVDYTSNTPPYSTIGYCFQSFGPSSTQQECNVNESFRNPDNSTGTFTGVARAVEDFGSPLRVYTHVSWDNMRIPIGITAIGSATLQESFIIHPLTSHPVVGIKVWFTWSGRINLGPLTGGGALFEIWQGSNLAASCGLSPNTPAPYSLQATGTCSSPFYVIPAGAPIDFSFELTAHAVNWLNAPEGSATVDFGHSVGLTNIEITDPEGNPISATVSSSSGVSYPINQVADVPEPGFTLLTAALSAVILFRRTRP